MRPYYKNRRLKIVLIGIIALGLILVLLDQTYVCRGHAACAKCYLQHRWYRIEIFGYPMIVKDKYIKQGTPELRAVQDRCSHYYLGLSVVSGNVFGDGEHGCGSWPIGHGWARMVESNGGMRFLVEVMVKDDWLSPKERPYWAWFMQQATRQDFGITFDEEIDPPSPVVPEGAIEKIFTWWEREGKNRYSSTSE